MSLKTIALCFACLAAGLVIGRLLPGGTPDATPVQGGGTSIAVRSPGIPVRAAGERAGESTAGRRAGDDPAENDAVSSNPVESGKGMLLVPSALIGELSLAAGTRTLDQELFTQDDRIEEALKITDHEKAVVQTAWRASRQKIRDLETASMKTEQIDEWSTRVTVPDQSAAMASLGNDFRSAVHRALGGSRAEAFLAAKQIDGLFSPPAGDRSYTVTSESVGNGEWRFRMTLEGPDGSRVWVGENIPNEIRHLVGDVRLAP